MGMLWVGYGWDKGQYGLYMGHIWVRFGCDMDKTWEKYKIDVGKTEFKVWA